MSEHQPFQRRCYLLVLVVISLAACTRNPQQVPTSALPSSHTQAPSLVSSPMDIAESVSRFTLREGTHRSVSHVYTFYDSGQASKLRHGHKEFTIVLAGAHQSLIIAFIGYAGPDTYTLSNRINGGDIRIAIGQQYWDLSLDPAASCRLRILTDVPTAQVGVDKLTGSFSCPMVPAGPQNHSPSPITVTDGMIDVSIIVES